MLTATERYVLDRWRTLYGREWKAELIRLWRGEDRTRDDEWEGGPYGRPLPVNVLEGLRAKFGPGLSRLKDYGITE